MSTSTSRGQATRGRIVAAAGQLFADQGIRATSVAQIEAAAGLRPGSGGVHRYFATKDDLVEAVFAAQVARGREVLAEAQAIPMAAATSLAEYLQAIGTKLLADAEDGRDVSLIALRDAASVPEAAKALLAENDEIAYGYAAASFAEQIRTSPALADRYDPEALAFLLVGSLVYFKLSGWLAGAPKLGLTDERLVRTWVSVFEPTFGELTGPTTEQGPPDRARVDVMSNDATIG